MKVILKSHTWYWLLSLWEGLHLPAELKKSATTLLKKMYSAWEWTRVSDGGDRVWVSVFVLVALACQGQWFVIAATPCSQSDWHPLAKAIKHFVILLQSGTHRCRWYQNLSRNWFNVYNLVLCVSRSCVIVRLTI